MRVGLVTIIFSVVTFSQTLTFEIASVKANPRPVGPDHNNQLTIAPAQLVGRNITLRRLISEAYSVQMNQVVGPRWLDENEYDVDARAGTEVSQERMRSMLQALLTERFHLREHTERRTLRAYELMVDKGGPKIAPSNGRASATTNGGFLFHGGMRQLADLIAVQLTISTAIDPTRPAIAGGAPPLVLDRTGLDGVYDFAVDVRPEPDADAFTLWQRFARERLGLRLKSRRGLVPVVVVDSTERTPGAN